MVEALSILGQNGSWSRSNIDQILAPLHLASLNCHQLVYSERMFSALVEPIAFTIHFKDVDVVCHSIKDSARSPF